MIGRQIAEILQHIDSAIALEHIALILERQGKCDTSLLIIR